MCWRLVLWMHWGFLDVWWPLMDVPGLLCEHSVWLPKPCLYWLSLVCLQRWQFANLCTRHFCSLRLRISCKTLFGGCFPKLPHSGEENQKRWWLLVGCAVLSMPSSAPNLSELRERELGSTQRHLVRLGSASSSSPQPSQISSCPCLKHKHARIQTTWWVWNWEPSN